MEKYFAAIDPGSSKITAAIGKKSDEGKITVLHVEKTDSEGCIVRGYIYNLAVAIEKMAMLIDRLNDNYAKPKLNAPVERVYVGVGGQGLYTDRHSISRQVEGGVIEQRLPEEMGEEMGRYKPEIGELLEILPADYYADGQLAGNPRGVTATVLEARYRLIVVEKPRLDFLRKAVPDKIGIAGYVVTPKATADAVLNKKEKESGCALVEIGAGVTTVSIYKNGKPEHLFTIPLGGFSVTKDICNTFGVSEREAESLKRNYGSAIPDMTDKSITVGKGISERTIGIRELHTVIAGRTEEILANVVRQIEESEHVGALTAGAVITGGGALLHGLDESFRNGINRSVRMAYSAFGGAGKPEDAAIVGMLAMAEVECIHYRPQPKPSPGKRGRMQGVKDTVRGLLDKGAKSLFDDSDYDPAPPRGS